MSDRSGRKYNFMSRRPHRGGSSGRMGYDRRIRRKSDDKMGWKDDEFGSPYIRRPRGSSRIRTFFEKKKKKILLRSKTPPYERSIDMLHRYREYKEYYSDHEHRKLQLYKNPQKSWLISNSPRRHEPNIMQKPNAVEELETSLRVGQVISQQIEDINHMKSGHNGLGGPVLSSSSAHPYASEIQKFEYTNEQLEVDRVIDLFELNKCFEHRSVEYVDTRERLQEIVGYLDGQREFGVNCQQHTFRSFQGFICLLEISTYYKDYVIDAIKLRNDIHLLNQAFTNPDIVKVIHNADHKLLWLQRDFSMYMVNIFDIQVGATFLYETDEKTSLMFLLNRFYSVEIGSDLEAFDWRFRPIPSEMIFYLMSTTYFLLLLYHQLKRDLLDKYKTQDSVPRVFDWGRVQCARRYEKVMKADERILAKKFLELDFSDEQKQIYRGLFELRDELARKNDESWRFYINDEELDFLCEHVVDEVEDPNFGDVIFFYEKSDRIPVLLARHLPEVIEIIQQHHPRSFRNRKSLAEDEEEEEEEGESSDSSEEGETSTDDSSEGETDDEEEGETDDDDDSDDDEGEGESGEEASSEGEGEQEEEKKKKSGITKEDVLIRPKEEVEETEKEEVNNNEEEDKGVIGDKIERIQGEGDNIDNIKKEGEKEVKKDEKIIITPKGPEKSEIEKSSTKKDEIDVKSDNDDDNEISEEKEIRKSTKKRQSSYGHQLYQLKKVPLIPPVKLMKRKLYGIDEINYSHRSAREVFDRVCWTTQTKFRNPFVAERRKALSFDSASSRSTGARRKSFFSGMVWAGGGGGGQSGGSGPPSPTEEIPSSLSEIYELSQISRRKNSQKKKKKKKAMIEDWKKKFMRYKNQSSDEEEDVPEINPVVSEKKVLMPLQHFFEDIGWK